MKLLMQPTFNPWLGYFDLIDKVDKFIFLDTVQLDQHNWQTRNKLKIQDKEFMFSIPVKNSLKQFINKYFDKFWSFDFREKLLKR